MKHFSKTGFYLFLAVSLLFLQIFCTGLLFAEDVERATFESGSPDGSSEEYNGTSAVGSSIIGSSLSTNYKLNIGPEATRNHAPVTSIISPDDGKAIDDDTPVLQWSFTDKDDDPQRMYQVQISKDGFETFVVDSGLVDSNAQLFTTPILPNTEANIPYKWRVRTHDGYDLSGWVYADNGFEVGAGEFDISVLGAKTSVTGSEILPQTWQTDKDPYFWWEAPSEGVGVAGYSYGVDALPDDKVDITTTGVQLGKDSLADGQHTFYVAASNLAGTWGNPAAFNIWVDALAPSVVSFYPAEGSVINDDQPRIYIKVFDMYSGEDPESVVFKLNGSVVDADYDEESGEFSYTPDTQLSEGGNTVHFEIKDKVGTKSIPFVWGFSVDTEGPVGEIKINNGDEMTTSVYVRLSFTFSDDTTSVASVSISNDGIFDTEGWETIKAVKEDWMLTPVSGTKRVWVKFKDIAGNESQPASDDILLIIKFPETYITSGPSGFVSSDSAYFAFSASKEGSLFSWSFDDEDWTTWSSVSEVQRSGIENGNHYFRVRAAKDVNNNSIIDPDEIDPEPATRTWIVGEESDSTAPAKENIKIWKIE